MRTSVVMAVYNGGTFLREQLASLAQQGRLPDELVISDDGSTDATLEIIKDFAPSVPFSVLLIANRKRLGFARNFISAAQAASGELIFFCDQDDVWSSNKIETVVRTAAQSPEGVISHDISVFGDDPGKPRFPSYYRYLHEQGFSPAVCFKGCSLAVKAGFLRDWGWPPPGSGISHDFWIALLATAFGQRRYLPDPLVQHRLHANNASGWIASRGHHVPRNWPRAPGQPVAAEVETLVELCIRPWNLTWTDAFLAALGRKAGQLDPYQAETLAWALHQNRLWYQRPE